jgi:hypothetical protein
VKCWSQMTLVYDIPNFNLNFLWHHFFVSVPRPFRPIADQDTCDAAKSEDGSKCVWCSIASFGVCVSEDIAEKMKEQIPGLQCDDDKTDDDTPTDDNAATDDMAPVVDDTAPNDDTVPGREQYCVIAEANGFFV